MAPGSKVLLWLHGEITSPPFSVEARREAGYLIRLVQDGQSIGMPRSRPMPSIGPRCHELRIQDKDHSWRIVYAVEETAILILDIFPKSTAATPTHVIDACRRRLSQYRRDLES
jgi:phage-related protein